MQFTVLDPSMHRADPGNQGAIGPDGALRVMPAEFYRQFSTEELMIFANQRAIYNLPTLELVAWLKQAFGALSVLEIGAGNGVLADALDIPASDNWMQTWPDIVAHYQMLRQPTVQYGPRVLRLDALGAIDAHKPDVVLACWVTHKYRADRHEMGGNMFGVDEEAVCGACKTYVHVGNSVTHANKSIRSMPHRRYTFDWLISRASNPDHNEICVWGERLPGEPA